jgi:hypothetical protein
MDEIQVNFTTPGNQQQPTIAGFQGTQVIIAWEDRSDNTIKAQFLSVTGTQLIGELLVSSPGPAGTKRQMPALLETSSGFVVAWIEQAGGGGRPQLKLRRFDQDTLSGPEIQVSSAEIEPSIRPALARLPDGGFILVWVDKRLDQRIRAQRFGLDGEKAGPEFRVNTTPGGHRNPMVAGLANGNVVVGWLASVPGPQLVHLQILDANGRVGGEQTTALQITDAAMAALDTGRFVITHARNPGDVDVGPEPILAQASVFEANGAFSGIRFPATKGRIQASSPVLAPLSGGRFVLVWKELNLDAVAAGTNIMGRLFSQQGAIGKAMQINTSKGHNRFHPCATATAGPDGETLFAAWADDTHSVADPSGSAVRARPLPIPSGGF